MATDAAEADPAWTEDDGAGDDAERRRREEDMLVRGAWADETHADERRAD